MILPQPTVVLAVVVRSEAFSSRTAPTSISSCDLTALSLWYIQAWSYLITYSIATDAESQVYKSHFSNHLNIQRRRQSHMGGPSHAALTRSCGAPGKPRASEISVCDSEW